MNNYQGLTNYYQTIYPNQTNNVIYAEPVIHEPIYYPNSTNNHYDYSNVYAQNNGSLRNSPYNPAFGQQQRSTLNPNMFQPIMSGAEPFNLQKNIENLKQFVGVHNEEQPANVSHVQTNENQTNNQPTNVHPTNGINQTPYHHQPAYQQQMHSMYPNHTQPYPTQTQQPTNNQNHPVDPYFVNPLNHQSTVNHPMYNPYPKMKILPKQQSTSNSILSSFKTPEGKYDVVSVVNTAGQMVNVVNQVGSIFKGIGGIFKV